MFALLCELSNETRTRGWNWHICIYLCTEVGGQIPTFDFRYKKLKILPFMVTNVRKDGTFPAYSCFSTTDSFRFEEIVSGNGTFQDLCADQFESSTSPPRATPRAFELLKIFLFKSPPPRSKKAAQMPHQ